MLRFFLLGGTIFTAIHYFANIVKNPGTAAIVALLPISLFSGFLIEDRKILEKYSWNLVVIAFTTLFSIVLLWLFITRTTFDKNYIVGSVLILWFILQWFTYKYC